GIRINIFFIKGNALFLSIKYVIAICEFVKCFLIVHVEFKCFFQIDYGLVIIHLSLIDHGNMKVDLIFIVEQRQCFKQMFQSCIKLSDATEYPSSDEKDITF